MSPSRARTIESGLESHGLCESSELSIVRIGLETAEVRGDNETRDNAYVRALKDRPNVSRDSTSHPKSNQSRTGSRLPRRASAVACDRPRFVDSSLCHFQPPVLCFSRLAQVTRGVRERSVRLRPRAKRSSTLKNSTEFQTQTRGWPRRGLLRSCPESAPPPPPQTPRRSETAAADRPAAAPPYLQLSAYRSCNREMGCAVYVLVAPVVSWKFRAPTTPTGNAPVL